MRQVIHLDLDAFFASVEVLLNPNLSGKPLIVAMGNPHGRGVVSTASYEARRFGVHSAMPLFQAARLCPQAIIVPVRHHIYSEYSRRVMAILREASPLVEQVSIDEAYVGIEPARMRHKWRARFSSASKTKSDSTARLRWRATNSSPRSRATRSNRAASSSFHPAKSAHFSRRCQSRNCPAPAK
ncbi:MAG TPA: hypothetical protein VF429_02410 [Anaerolineae bacterium]